jgi:hypothetical protein
VLDLAQAELDVREPALAFRRARSIISGVMSTPMTPSGPTARAASAVEPAA